MIKANFVWQLPKLDGSTGASRSVGAIVNNWQLSGVFTGGSGLPYDARYSYQSNGSNANLTGSPNYLARIVVRGDPGSGCSSNPYKQFNTEAFSGPTYHSVGDESGANLLHYCALKIMDLAIARSFSFGGARSLQFRLDLFNAFNTVVYNAVQFTEQLNSPATPTTVTNNQYLADGTLNPARLQPQTAGFGAATGAGPMRSAQVQLRLQF